MEEKKVNFGCSLDCFGNCSLVATVENGKVIKIEGNKNHPLTQGVFCIKGKKHLERVYHHDRILSPKRKENGKWVDISYEEALGEISRKLLSYKKEYGSESVLLFSSGGYNGLSKSVDDMFFNYYGGVTKAIGSLCLGAGKEAQKIDFGANKEHDPKDVLNSKTIFVWGRNPADTNIHLMKYLIEAKDKGAQIYVVDPIKTNTAKAASKYIRLNPGTDGALAFGIANYLINNALIDEEFINKNVKGYEEYKEYAKSFNLDYVMKITGVDKEVIIELAKAYGENTPSSIYIGYGLQRYRNGGNNVRAIDSLGAITGNIGKSGGGVNYYHKTISKYVFSEVDKSEELPMKKRNYIVGQLGDFILNTDNPPVKCMFINKGNPMVQVGDINKTIEAFKKVDFIVAIDLFMTDSAKYADLILPATSTLEEEDFNYTGMYSPYLSYSQRVIEPVNNILGEYELFRLLAKKMELKDYPDIDKETFFRSAMKPLMEKAEVSYEYLKENYLALEGEEIPWQDGIFDTPSGKYELYSETAKNQGLSPIPKYIPVREKDDSYSLRLLTPHPKNSLHSQHFAFDDNKPIAYINGNTLKQEGFENKQLVKIQSSRGEIEVQLAVSDIVGENIIMMYEGIWHKSGSVNMLTTDEVSDIGDQSAYYESFCRLESIG
ncbi:molybdopterin-dependent oxidoreductase [Clostridium sp.]|uniref:molybdopterin-containing oxidoreductase family protein n=1 Tax=Clostridium sp. TaxID=1506 RepID=UPI002FCB7FA0